jgi:hypothetical protein
MDRPAHHPRRSWFLVVVSTAGIVAAGLTQVAAIGTWLLVTDPEVAGEVAAAGSLMPVLTAMAQAAGRAIVSALVYL